MNMNPLWKTYKNKVLKTLNSEVPEEAVEESREAEENPTPVQEDEGPGAVSQLAKRMQGAGVKGWKSISALFNKGDEHQLLQTEPQPVADHPLAIKPEEPQPIKRNMGFWDSFATKWQQAAAMRRAEAEAEAASNVGEDAAGQEGGEGQSQVTAPQEGQESGEQVEGGGGSVGNSFSKYAGFGGGGQDTALKWNFVTSRLAELKTKSMNKTE